MQHKNPYRIILLAHCLLALVSTSSCVEEFTADLPKESTHYLVVQGDIIGESTNTFYFDYTYGISESSTALPALKEVCVVGDDGSTYPCTRNDERQVSYSVDLPKLSPNVNYSLHFTTAEGHAFVTEAQTPALAPSLDELSFSRDKEKGGVTVTVSAGRSTVGENCFVRYDIDECWEIITPYQPTHEYDPGTGSIVALKNPMHHGWAFHSESLEDVYRTDDYETCVMLKKPLFKLTATNDRLQTLYRLVVHQYGISKKEYDYIILRQRMGSDMGGLFTPQPSELPSNVQCTNASERALGFVGVCAAPAIDTLYIRSKEAGYSTSHKAHVLTDEEIESLGGVEKLYGKGYRISFYERRSGITEWALRWCVDSSDPLWGCTQFTAPDGWPVY